MDKTAQLVVGVLLVAFVIERVTAAITFFIDTRDEKERKRKLMLIGIGGALAAIALWKVDIRLMRDALNITTHPRVDHLLTWLMVVGGANRIGTFVGGQAEAKEKPEPITFVVEERDGQLVAVQKSQAS